MVVLNLTRLVILDLIARGGPLLPAEIGEEYARFPPDLIRNCGLPPRPDAIYQMLGDLGRYRLITKEHRHYRITPEGTAYLQAVRKYFSPLPVQNAKTASKVSEPPELPRTEDPENAELDRIWRRFGSTATRAPLVSATRQLLTRLPEPDELYDRLLLMWAPLFGGLEHIPAATRPALDRAIEQTVAWLQDQKTEEMNSK
jgi:DNA-binding PadR family transcriptional regulator